jgi:plastocyanin
MHRNLSPASATLVLLAALIAVVVLVACERKPTAQPKVVTVAIREFKFEPATVTVHAGDTVEWKNEDNVAHTATADDKAQSPAFDSGSIQTGAAWRYVAQKKGTENYTCTFHPNMKGELIVQ